MGSPAALCVSGMTASSPTGTKLGRCAAVGSCLASPPSHPHAVQSVWDSGGKRARVSTSRHVPTGALAHSYGSLCLPCLHPLPAEERLWRCRSTTRHEPAARAHSYGSLCLPCLHPLPAEERLWRCRSTTRHEPAGGCPRLPQQIPSRVPQSPQGGRAG